MCEVLCIVAVLCFGGIYTDDIQCCESWSPDGTLVAWDGTKVTRPNGVIECPKPKKNCTIYSTGEVIMKACQTSGDYILPATMNVVRKPDGLRYIFDTRVPGNYQVVVPCCRNCGQ